MGSKLAAAALACCLALPASAAQTPAPPFRAQADLVTIDLQVTKKNGGVIPLLVKDRFEVRIDGRRRALQSATLLHEDDGPVVRGLTAPRLDATSDASCMFHTLRARNVAHAHYRIGIETTAADRRRVGTVRVKTTSKDLVIVRWAWRTPVNSRGPS